MKTSYGYSRYLSAKAARNGETKGDGLTLWLAYSLYYDHIAGNDDLTKDPNF